jgi:hypothetical protein
MQNLYKISGGVVVAPVMVALVDHEWWLSGETLWPNPDKKIPPVSRMAKNLMAAVEGSALSNVAIVKVPEKKSATCVGEFVVVLHADQGVLIMVEDETVQVQSGDVWWVRSPFELINNSGDHAVVLSMGINL